jgi:hypothetical protein
MADVSYLRGLVVSSEFIGVGWDGAGLPVHASTGAGQMPGRVPRDTIHAIPFYSDAIDREIRSERHSILQEPAPTPRAELTVAEPGEWADLLLSDFFDRRSVPKATEASRASSQVDS